MSLPEGFGWWVVIAVTLFWVVGAYNRLVRLRSMALQAYSVLDAALQRQLEYVQLQVVDERLDQSMLPEANQLAVLLAATRQRPLEPTAITALSTALRVLLVAWQRLHPEQVTSFASDGSLSRPASLDGLASSGPAEDFDLESSHTTMAWPGPSPAAEIARSQFNLAVSQYNNAISQFPAMLIAWIFRQRPAAPLD